MTNVLLTHEDLTDTTEALTHFLALRNDLGIEVGSAELTLTSGHHVSVLWNDGPEEFAIIKVIS